MICHVHPDRKQIEDSIVTSGFFALKYMPRRWSIHTIWILMKHLDNQDDQVVIIANACINRYDSAIKLSA